MTVRTHKRISALHPILLVTVARGTKSLIGASTEKNTKANQARSKNTEGFANNKISSEISAP